MRQVLCPVSGQSRLVSDVPDPVFARGLVGPGVAINPAPGPQTAVAPITGQLVRLLPHAYLVRSDQGPGVLVHLGIDTVHLQGAGFSVLRRELEQVDAGEDVVSWDPQYVAGTGRSAICAVIMLDCDAPVVLEELGSLVHSGEPLFSVDC